MKKSLTLLMLAALASFVSCKEEPALQNEYVRVTVTAETAATRAVLGDKTASSYPILWTSGCQVGFYAGDGQAVWAAPSTSGATATFSVSLPDVSEGSLVALSPKSADGVAGGFTAYSIVSPSVACIMPAEQTPTSSSCDESALLLAASMEIPSTGIPSDIDLHFAPVNAFGRLVLSNLPAADIKSVTLGFPVAVAGTEVEYSVEDGSLSGAGVKTLTLLTDNLTPDAAGDFTVWFGCVPAAMASGTFTVTVEDGEGKTYSKSIDLSDSRALELVAGHVRPILVDMEGTAVETLSEVVLWSETWTGGSKDETPSGYGFEGTTVYGGATVAYSQSSTETKLYNESLAGGTSPELLLKKNITTWTVSGIPTAGAASMTLTLKANKTYFTVSSPTSGISVTDEGSFTWTLANPSDLGTFTLVFTTSGSDNVRLDDILLVGLVSSGGAAPATAVHTEEATDVTASTAVLNASFSNASAVPEYAGFYWGTSEASLDGDRSYTSSVISSTGGTFSAVLDNLTEGVTYYYKAYIKVYEGSEYVEYVSSEVKSLRTSSSQGAVSGDQYGWFELPQMDYTISGSYKIGTDNTDNYYAYHMCAGGETGPDGKTARNYSLCFSGTHHCPLWVAAPRHSMYVGSSGRNEAYTADGAVPSGIQYSSTSTIVGCSKGHMLGSAERTSSVATNKQVFYYTNIAPQLSTGFNTGGGGWNLLEDWVDTKVCADTLYEVVGCYFDEFTDGYGYTVSPEKISFGGRTDVSMPTMFYYVLLRTKSGNSGKSLKDCSADEMMCAAFVRAHTNSLKGQAPTRSEMMSVSDLEKVTGFNYFVNVPNAPKTVLNPSDWGL
ncbi:MAG: DNA/RNA non-specific endonuclease [Candidatus Cryptobacteroides sp.]